MEREGVAAATTRAIADQQHVLYELTQYALRNPGLEDLAAWQYERYYEVGTQYLRDVAAAAGIEWAVPVPVVSRMLVSFIDGMGLGWLVDRNTDEARAALEAFIDGLCLLARSVGNKRQLTVGR
jgi:hypothetical protein